MNCKAGHACSKRCSDPCACLCEQTRHDVVSDDVVTPAAAAACDSPFGPGLHPEVHSLQSELSGNAGVFNVADQQEWEAPSSQGSAPQSMKFSLTKGIMIRDTHRPVALSNGSRKTGRPTATILNSPQVQQNWPQSGPLQRKQNTTNFVVNQLVENISPEPQALTLSLDTYAAVARGPWHPPLPPAPDVRIATSQTRLLVSRVDKTDSNSTEGGPGDVQKHSLAASRRREVNTERKAPYKKPDRELQALSMESQTYDPSDNDETHDIGVITQKIDSVQIGEDDLISFD